MGESGGHQPVPRHGKQHPRLTINHHEHDRGESDNRCRRNPVAYSRVSHLTQHERQGFLRQGQFPAGLRSNRADGRISHDQVNQRTNRQRADEPDRYITVGIFGFFRSCRDGVTAIWLTIRRAIDLIHAISCVSPAVAQMRKKLLPDSRLRFQLPAENKQQELNSCRWQGVFCF